MINFSKKLLGLFGDFTDLLSLDIESFSFEDIKAGTFKYAERAIPIIVAWSFNDEPVQYCDLTRETLPDRVKRGLVDPKVLKKAYNAAFERTVLSAFYEIELPPEQWQCTMIRAAMLGLPLSLGQAAIALGLPQEKDTKGKALIKYFCVPCEPTKVNNFRTRNLPEHAPDKWLEFCQYCCQDVVVEKEIDKACSWFNISEYEREQWYLDQRINSYGVKIDRKLVNNAIKLDAYARDKLSKEATMLTGLSNSNAPAQIKEWLKNELGVEIPALTKESVTALLKTVTTEKGKRVLQLRAEMAKTSVKKYVAMLKSVSEDGRIRGMLQYYGANRTGRYGGRLVQPQNLPRITFDPKYDGLENLRNFVLNNDTESIEFYFGSIPGNLSQLIRTAFVPAEGCRFIVSDYSAIEARVIAWAAGEQWRLDLFENKGKIYEASASKMFGIPVEEISKDSPWRQAGKVAELSCGYQGGPDALQRMIDSERAKGAVIELTYKELLPIIKAWRKANPAIVQFWYLMQEAAVNAIETRERTPTVRGGYFDFRNGCLLMGLPSGRELVYQSAYTVEEDFWQIVSTVTMEDGKLVPVLGKIASLTKANFAIKTEKRQVINATAFLPEENQTIKVQIEKQLRTRKIIKYKDVNQTTKKWGTNGTYGGKLVENFVQAVARDILCQGLLNLAKAGYKTVLHVHDETVNEMPFGEGSLDEVNELMIKPEPWYAGLPLAAAGFESFYYKKD